MKSVVFLHVTISFQLQAKRQIKQVGSGTPMEYVFL